jgi:hypothetical protein
MNSTNTKIWELWQKHAQSFNEERMPLFYPKINEDALLFIGVNPSFNEKGLAAILRGIGIEIFDINDYFAYRSGNNIDLEAFIKQTVEMDRYARETSPYFARFKDLSSHFNVHPWDHIDLFFIRETSQNVLKQKVFSNHKNLTLNSFGRDQLNLSKQMIEASKPKLIVVANALASHIFQQEYNTNIDGDKGCHFVNFDGKNIPVFLCSMLTRQRALDNFSYERLKWHIGMALLDIQ